MRKQITFLGFLAASIALLLSATGCGSSNSASSTEDYSSSGSVASAIGGGVNGSSGGTVSLLEQKRSSMFAQLFDLNRFLPDALAANAVCPTIAGSATGCSVSSSTATLTYSNCSFSGSGATWSGSQAVAFTGATPVCGSTFPTSQSQVVRTFPTDTTRTAASGTSVVIDTNGASNYLSSNISGGYTVAWSSGKPTSININGINLVGTSSGGSALFKYSITTPSPISISYTAGGGFTASGTVTVYHNIARVTATSTISGLVYQAGSCTPFSGSISTVFGSSSNSKYNGVTETLSFSNGVATYTGPDGTSGTVTLSHCF